MSISELPESLFCLAVMGAKEDEAVLAIANIDGREAVMAWSTKQRALSWLVDRRGLGDVCEVEREELLKQCDGIIYNLPPGADHEDDIRRLTVWKEQD